MDVKAAIDASDVASIERILASDPQQANALVRWVDSREHLTHPLHYVCDKVFGGTLTSDQGSGLEEEEGNLDCTETRGGIQRVAVPVIDIGTSGQERPHERDRPSWARR